MACGCERGGYFVQGLLFFGPDETVGTDYFANEFHEIVIHRCAVAIRIGFEKIL